MTNSSGPSRPANDRIDSILDSELSGLRFQATPMGDGNFILTVASDDALNWLRDRLQSLLERNHEFFPIDPVEDDAFTMTVTSTSALDSVILSMYAALNTNEFTVTAFTSSDGPSTRHEVWVMPNN